MIISYIATAGIAVLIISIYYLTAYEPANDPFERDGQNEMPFFPNPVDYYLLRWIRGGLRCVLKRFIGSRWTIPFPLQETTQFAI